MRHVRLRTAIDPASLAAPRVGAVAWDRIAGMLVGLAIGDSLGNTSESMVPRERNELYGDIR